MYRGNYSTLILEIRKLEIRKGPEKSSNMTKFKPKGTLGRGRFWELKRL